MTLQAVTTTTWARDALITLGGLTLMVGSGIQAWDALRTSGRELQALGEAAWKAYREVILYTVIPIVSIVAYGGFWKKFTGNLEDAAKGNAKQVEHLREVARSALSWSLILYGSLAVVIASLIQLGQDANAH